MKPFNLEQAKAGKAVVTRDGLPVRIVCWDAKLACSLVGLISIAHKQECLANWNLEGRDLRSPNDLRDLMMATEKREGWVNVYPTDMHRTAFYASQIIYDNEIGARASAHNGAAVQCRIEWEE